MWNINSIYVGIQSVDEGSHVIGDVGEEVASTSDARTDHGDRLIHGVLDVLLDFQERVPALAHFRHYVAFHEDGDVVQRERHVWQLKNSHLVLFFNWY